VKNRDDSMEWFPFWVDKWIFGSTRIELQPDERAIWIDLLAIAAKDNGHIRANITTPYPPQQLAGLLCITEELLQRALQRCIETGKIEEIFINKVQNQTLSKSKPDNIFAGYRIINWAAYQLSERHKRRFEAAKFEVQTMSSKTDTMSSKTDTIGEDIKKRRGYKEEKRRESPPPSFSQTDIIDLYHQTLPELPKIVKWTEARKRNLRICLQDTERQTLEFWKRYFEMVKKSAFLLGENDRGWKADLEWLTREANLIRVMEEKYYGTRIKPDNRKHEKGTTSFFGHSDGEPYPIDVE